MLRDFPPLKNDLLLRAARGESAIDHVVFPHTNILQVKRLKELQYGSCDKQVVTYQVRIDKTSQSQCGD